MTKADHLERLKQDVAEWNWWRGKNLRVKPDLSGADLRGVDLSGADLRDTNLRGVDLSGADLLIANLSGADLLEANLSRTNLSRANLSEADLRGVDLREANLRGADLHDSNLRGANLCDANLRGVDLRDSNLRGAILSGVNLSKFDLSGLNLSEADLCAANLSRTQMLGTNFERAVFTGTCLQDWNINSATNFDDAICDYVYLKANQQERRPREGLFKPGEFAALFQQAVDTVDLIFKDGIDWQAFFQSFQELRDQYAEEDLSIQAIEKKRGGTFVVRVEVAEGSDKQVIENRAKELYETKLVLLEQRYRNELQAKDREISLYKKSSASMEEIAKLLAGRSITVETTAVAENNSSKYDLNNAQFAGGFAETVQGNQVGGTINNAAAETPSLAEAAAEIQNLLQQLEASNPSPTQAQQTAYLDALIPPTRRERFIGALKAASGAAIEEVPYGAVLKALVEGWQKPEG